MHNNSIVMKCIIDEMISANRLPETDTDALSSMLMSWYISGFHTGIFLEYLKSDNINVRFRCAIISNAEYILISHTYFYKKI